MTSLEMIQYRRTDDMKSLYLMLDSEKAIYDLWHDTAERLARRLLTGKDVNYDELADEYGKKIAISLDRLCVRYHKICGEWLQLTDEQELIVAWQWFYNVIIETALFLKQALKNTKYSLVGVDGNAYAIMVYVTCAMRECGKTMVEIDDYIKQAKSSDYNHLVSEDMCDELNKIA